MTAQTVTVGLTWLLSSAITNDLRFNYSRTSASLHFDLDTFGGAVPLASLPFPTPLTSQDSLFSFRILSLSNGILTAGRGTSNRQRQVNLVDNLFVQKSSHSLKFGVDFRRLSPQIGPFHYQQLPFFLNVSRAMTGNLFLTGVRSSIDGAFLLNNLSVFAQDTWRIRPRLTLTYGLRWEVDFPPSSSSGPAIAAVTGFNLNNLSNLALAPAGTSPYRTTYGNVAPRLGIAYQLSQNQDRQTVLRGGFGVFYDLASSAVGNQYNFGAYPFGAQRTIFGGTFPLAPAAAAPPPIQVPGGGSGTVLAFDPNLKLPYTLQWNVALEQGLGKQQTISASYIGAVGRRLLQTAVASPPNPNFALAQLVGNTAMSKYNALQIQFQRRLSRGLQALASYTWSHSIDDGSAGSADNNSNLVVPGINPNTNRGPSDFDIRNAMSAGVTYDIPPTKITTFANAILRGWSFQTVIQIRSAPPTDAFDNFLGQLLSGLTNVRPDVISGQPLYLYGSQFPGGKAFNPAAFTDPPVDPITGIPLRQGNLSRNALRGFGAAQLDFAVHRDFPIRESLKLQFRAEMFNVLNHPSFGQPNGDISSPQFGLSTQMLGRSLSNGNIGGGGFNPLYQIGGPRSIQFGLKLTF